jgi:hypothetical protein
MNYSYKYILFVLIGLILIKFYLPEKYKSYDFYLYLILLLLILFLIDNVCYNFEKFTNDNIIVNNDKNMCSLNDNISNKNTSLNINNDKNMCSLNDNTSNKNTSLNDLNDVNKLKNEIQELKKILDNKNNSNKSNEILELKKELTQMKENLLNEINKKNSNEYLQKEINLLKDKLNNKNYNLVDDDLSKWNNSSMLNTDKWTVPMPKPPVCVNNTPCQVCPSESSNYPVNLMLWDDSNVISKNREK